MANIAVASNIPKKALENMADSLVEKGPSIIYGVLIIVVGIYICNG